MSHVFFSHRIGSWNRSFEFLFFEFGSLQQKSYIIFQGITIVVANSS